MKWVQTRGRVVILVPEGFLFTENRRLFRHQLLGDMRVVAIISINSPISSLPVKTSILVLDKEPSNTEPYDVFLSSISEIPSSGAFDSRGSLQISKMLHAFDQWTNTRQFDASKEFQVVSVRTLEAENLTVSHYLAPSLLKDEKLASLFPLVPLQEIAEDIKRGAKIKLDDKGDLPVIGPNAIRPMLLDVQKVGRTSQEQAPAAAPMVRSGDLVINNISTHLGDAAVVDDDLIGALMSQHVIMIRPIPERVLPEYLAIALNSEFVRQQIGESTGGVLIPSLRLNAFKRIFIPLPDKTVQLRVIDKMRRARLNLLSAQEQLREAEAQFTTVIDDLAKWGDEA